MAKKKQIEKVVISQAHYDVLNDAYGFLESLLCEGELRVRSDDFEAFDHIARRYDRIDMYTEGPDPYVEPEAPKSPPEPVSTAQAPKEKKKHGKK